MEIDFDDDIFDDGGTKNARRARKFQPKAKFRPQKKNPTANSVSSSNAVQTNDSIQSRLTEPAKTAETSKKHDEGCVAEDTTKATTGSDVMSSEKGGFDSFSEKSEANLFTGSDSVGDVLPKSTADMAHQDPKTADESTVRSGGGDHTDNRKLETEMEIDFDDDIFDVGGTKNVRRAGKFQPKAKFRPQKKNPTANSVSSSNAVQTNDSIESQLTEPDKTAEPSKQHDEGCVTEDTTKATTGSDVVSIEIGGCDSLMEKSEANLFTDSDSVGDFLLKSTADMAHQEPLTADESIVLSGEDDHTDKLETELQETDAMDTIDAPESTTRSGQKSGKFRPKPKIQIPKEKFQAKIDSVSGSISSEQVLPGISFDHDDAFDFTSIGVAQNTPPKATSGDSMNEEFVKITEIDQLDSSTHMEEGAPQVPAKLASRRAKTGKSKTPTAQDPSQPDQIASPVRSLRQRKSKANLCELLADESEEQDLASQQCSSIPALNEDNIDDQEYLLESQTKEVKRKRKKTDDDIEKPVRKKRNKSCNEESEKKHVDAKPKKFSHSTRRRKVNADLLEAAENDYEYYRKFPLRDLSILAQHKEKETKKEEMMAPAPPMRPSHDDSSEFYDEDDSFTNESGWTHTDGPSGPIIEESNVLYNYHSYMNRTPVSRWSKQETELFYEAMSQFGTDLSMIRLLFPGRTPRQVLLKYRKEEKQQPMRLHDALTNRTKDHSHFETVIENLRQIAAKENENDIKEDSVDLTANDEVEEQEEGNPVVNDEAAKNEQVEEEVAEEFEEAGSPMKLDDSEDEMLRWSQYKSDDL